MKTVLVQVDNPDLMLQGYNEAVARIDRHLSLGVIPYSVPSAGAIGYCQAVIEYCRKQQAIGAKFFTE